MVRGKVKKRRAIMPTKFEAMTEEEKRAAFEKWMANRENRKGQGKARRTAMQTLMKNHQAEYNKLLKGAGGKVKEG